MPDPRSQSYQHNMLYEGLDQTVTHGPPEGELPRSWFDPSTRFRAEGPLIPDKTVGRAQALRTAA